MRLLSIEFHLRLLIYCKSSFEFYLQKKYRQRHKGKEYWQQDTAKYINIVYVCHTEASNM